MLIQTELENNVLATCVLKELVPKDGIGLVRIRHRHENFQSSALPTERPGFGVRKRVTRQHPLHESGPHAAFGEISGISRHCLEIALGRFQNPTSQGYPVRLINWRRS